MLIDEKISRITHLEKLVKFVKLKLKSNWVKHNSAEWKEIEELCNQPKINYTNYCSRT